MCLFFSNHIGNHDLFTWCWKDVDNFCRDVLQCAEHPLPCLVGFAGDDMVEVCLGERLYEHGEFVASDHASSREESPLKPAHLLGGGEVHAYTSEVFPHALFRLTAIVDFLCHSQVV